MPGPWRLCACVCPVRTAHAKHPHAHTHTHTHTHHTSSGVMPRFGRQRPGCGGCCSEAGTTACCQRAAGTTACCQRAASAACHAVQRVQAQTSAQDAPRHAHTRHASAHVAVAAGPEVQTSSRGGSLHQAPRQPVPVCRQHLQPAQHDTTGSGTAAAASSGAATGMPCCASRPLQPALPPPP
jgi:hypothetical protein